MGQRAGCIPPKRRKPKCRRRKKPTHCHRRKSPTYRPIFTQKKALSISATGEFQSLPPVNTSHEAIYSFGIVNRGSSPIVAKVQISPDKLHYADDAEEIVAGGQTVALVPIRFLRYARVSIRLVDPDKESVVDIYYQAQSAG